MDLFGIEYRLSICSMDISGQDHEHLDAGGMCLVYGHPKRERASLTGTRASEYRKGLIDWNIGI